MNTSLLLLKAKVKSAPAPATEALKFGSVGVSNKNLTNAFHVSEQKALESRFLDCFLKMPEFIEMLLPPQVPKTGQGTGLPLGTESKGYDTSFLLRPAV